MTDKEKMLSAYKVWSLYQPAFTSWNGALYESDLIRSAISARARNISKLKIEIYGSVQSPLKTRLKRRPNPLQTWSQFLYRASTILDMENNCFIMPFYQGNEKIGYLCVPPSECQLTAVEGVIMLVYNSVNPLACEFSECGVLNQHQYKSDLFGASNKALTDTMELINLQKQGISEAIKNSAVYRCMAKYTEAVFSEDLKEEQKNFADTHFKEDEDGILLFPNSYNDIRQVDNKQYILDDKQTKIIQDNVFNYFGVNDKVLKNEVVGDSWTAFYEGAIEPFAIQFAEVFESLLFTDLEISNGNGIMLATNRLEHLSQKERAQMAIESFDRAIISDNEARAVIWGYDAREGGDIFTIRGEYKNAEDLRSGTNAEN